MQAFEHCWSYLGLGQRSQPHMQAHQIISLLIGLHWIRMCLNFSYWLQPSVMSEIWIKVNPKVPFLQKKSKSSWHICVCMFYELATSCLTQPRAFNKHNMLKQMRDTKVCASLTQILEQSYVWKHVYRYTWTYTYFGNNKPFKSIYNF